MTLKGISIMILSRLTMILSHLFIVALAALALFVLLRQEGYITSGGSHQLSMDHLMVQSLELDSWRSVYVNDQWIGYSNTRYGPTNGGYLLRSSSLLRFSFFGRLQDLVVESTQELDENHRLQNFTIDLSGMADVTITGRREGNRLLTEARYAGLELRKTFDAGEDFFLDQGILQTYRGSGMEPGSTYRFRVLNPLSLQVDEATLSVTGREGDFLVMETRLSGLTSKSWVDNRGMVVREETPQGWMIRAESQAQVDRRLQDSRHSALDILEEVAVRTDRIIPSPRSVRSMTVRVTGYDPSTIPLSDPRQVLVDRSSGLFRITVEDKPARETSERTSPTADLDRFLQPSLWIDPGDPAIVATSRKVVGDETDPWQAAVRIGQWVYENVRKVPSPGIPVATQVLADLQGDCNEHTSLFVALARAAGIPTDMAAGLVYLDGAFYYHVWPRVFVGTWVDMDPTFGQHVADAARIELVPGDFSEQARIAMAIGRIGLEIIDFQQDAGPGS